MCTFRLTDNVHRVYIFPPDAPEHIGIAQLGWRGTVNTKRKFFIIFGLNTYCVFERVRGGCRAVSKAFDTKADAQRALAELARAS